MGMLSSIDAGHPWTHPSHPRAAYPTSRVQGGSHDSAPASDTPHARRPVNLIGRGMAERRGLGNAATWASSHSFTLFHSSNVCLGISSRISHARMSPGSGTADLHPLPTAHQIHHDHTVRGTSARNHLLPSCSLCTCTWSCSPDPAWPHPAPQSCNACNLQAWPGQSLIVALQLGRAARRSPRPPDKTHAQSWQERRWSGVRGWSGVWAG